MYAPFQTEVFSKSSGRAGFHLRRHVQTRHLGLADSTYFPEYSAKDIKAMLSFRARIAEQESNIAKNTAEINGTGCTTNTPRRFRGWIV